MGFVRDRVRGCGLLIAISGSQSGSDRATYGHARRTSDLHTAARYHARRCACVHTHRRANRNAYDHAIACTDGHTRGHSKAPTNYDGGANNTAGFNIYTHVYSYDYAHCHANGHAHHHADAPSDGHTYISADSHSHHSTYPHAYTYTHARVVTAGGFGPRYPGAGYLTRLCNRPPHVRRNC